MGSSVQMLQIPHKPPVLIKTLTPMRGTEGDSEYLDVIGDPGGRSARVYTFWRDATSF